MTTLVFLILALTDCFKVSFSVEEIVIGVFFLGVMDCITCMIESVLRERLIARTIQGR